MTFPAHCGTAEESEEPKTEKEMLLRTPGCADDTGIFSVKKDIAATESTLKKTGRTGSKVFCRTEWYTERIRRIEGTGFRI